MYTKSRIPGTDSRIVSGTLAILSWFPKNSVRRTPYTSRETTMR